MASKTSAREALASYHGKRDFRKTPDPRKVARASRGGHSFVVQKHHARQLHYDFRLELDGTLKSWAVPKGPCLDPGVKRMAVHVEDHPVSYADFEGTIPPGQYGAGTVIVWDRGEWVAEGDARRGLAEGKLKFELRGDKLRGHWTLVRMRGKGGKHESWLLIKERDAEARPLEDFDIVEELPHSVLSGGDVDAPPGRGAALAASLAPQLATLASARPPRRKTGSTSSSSTATASWRASTATRCNASRATATTGARSSPVSRGRSPSSRRARPGWTARSLSKGSTARRISSACRTPSSAVPRPRSASGRATPVCARRSSMACVPTSRRARSGARRRWRRP